MADGKFDGFDGDDVESGDDDIEFIDNKLDDDLSGDFSGDEYEFEDLDVDPLGFEDVAEAIGLPEELPALRLPPDAELAGRARSAALPARLAGLAKWVGDDGRTTSDAGDLTDDDLAAAARALEVTEGELLFLWEYALDGDWVEFDDEDDDEDVFDGTASVVRGETARMWTSGDDDDVLDVWRTTLMSVLTSTFDVLLDSAPEPADALDFDGQGIAMAIMLFLARGEGLALTDISEVILETATAEMEADEAVAARDAWLEGYGDPARLITATLTELGAVTPPASDDGAVRLTRLGLWAVREELADIGVEVPLLPATVTEMTAEQLLLVADDADQEEFESESDAWVALRDPDQAARELLRVAANDGAESRLLAVSVVTRIGDAAEPAWRDSLGTPQLRPYAKIALATLAQVPEEAIPAELVPLPEDLAWVAIDMLVVACDDEEPDPDAVAECLSDSVPAGEEAMLFEMISRATHPDAVEVLRHIGRHHPDKRIAKDARIAARRAESRAHGTLS
jgi:hypothetical protein